jgi:hypothetical protein
MATKSTLFKPKAAGGFAQLKYPLDASQWTS